MAGQCGLNKDEMIRKSREDYFKTVNFERTVASRGVLASLESSGSSRSLKDLISLSKDTLEGSIGEIIEGYLPLPAVSDGLEGASETGAEFLRNYRSGLRRGVLEDERELSLRNFFSDAGLWRLSRVELMIILAVGSHDDIFMREESGTPILPAGQQFHEVILRDVLDSLGDQNPSQILEGGSIMTRGIYMNDLEARDSIKIMNRLFSYTVGREAFSRQAAAKRGRDALYRQFPGARAAAIAARDRHSTVALGAYSLRSEKIARSLDIEGLSRSTLNAQSLEAVRFDAALPFSGERPGSAALDLF